MSHHTPKTGYAQLAARLDKSPRGAFPSPLLHKILAIFFNEQEAHLVSRLPLLPFTSRRAAAIWKMPEGNARVFPRKSRLTGAAPRCARNAEGMARY